MSTAIAPELFAGLKFSASRLIPTPKLLFTKSAKHYFSLTTNQSEQYFSAKFQTSERASVTRTTVDIPFFYHFY